MVSFFSHGFASGGSSPKQEKKESKEEKEGVWLRIVDGRGQTINWQHSVTGAYYFMPVPYLVGGAFVVQPVFQQVQPVVQQVQPLARPVFQPAMPWGVNVMPMPPMKKKEKKDRENEGYWDSFRDENGMHYYKHSRTHKTTYTDPYK